MRFPASRDWGAVDVAGRRPDLVSHLVLIQTPSWDEEVRWKKSRDRLGVLATPVLGQLAMHFLKKSRSPKWLDVAMGCRQKLPLFCACANQTLKDGSRLGSRQRISMLPAGHSQPTTADRSSFLAIWGGADGSHVMTKKDSARKFGDAGQLKEYHDLEHFPELEDPERVFVDICKFARIR